VTRPAALVAGGVWLTPDLARKYHLAMSAVLRQAAARHPDARIPPDVQLGQEVIGLLGGCVSATGVVAHGMDAGRWKQATEGSTSMAGSGLSVAEVAELSGVSAQAVRRAISIGALTAERLGRRCWSIREIEARRWAAQRKRDAA